MEHCTICGRPAEEGEKFTHLKLYVNGSEGTNACEDCRMDLTNFARNLSSAMTRSAKRARKAAKNIGFGELIRKGGLSLGQMNTAIIGPSTGSQFDMIAPSAMASQIKSVGRVETTKGEVFKWKADSEMWVEEDTGEQRALRAFPAAESGFPDSPLDWRFRLPTTGAVRFTHKPNGSIQASIPLSTSGECSSFCHPGEPCSITDDGECQVKKEAQPQEGESTWQIQ